MQTLTEIVAAVVVHSSAAAYAHFGVAVDAQQVERPAAAERTVARTGAAKPVVKAPAKLTVKPSKASLPPQSGDCPDQNGRIVRA